MYEYSYGDPINYLDPSGLAPLPDCAKDTLASMGFPRSVLDAIDLWQASLIGRLFGRFGQAAVTLGNTVHTANLLDFSSTSGMVLVAHEAAHVWSVHVIGSPIFYTTYIQSGLASWIGTGSIHEARNFIPHEQYAERIEDFVRALLLGGICPNQCR